jgi:hypothetical protein
MGFLYVDGHVRAYHGQRAIASKAYVARRHSDELGNRLCRKRGIDLHEIGYAEHARDWRDVADEIVVELVEERRVNRVCRID